MNAEWLLSWWNVIFVVPFLVALMYLFVYAATGLTVGDADADGGLGAEAGADVDADADVDGDVHAVGGGHGHYDFHGVGGGDGEADGDEQPGGGAPHPSAQAAALSWLGVGRVPLNILLMVLLFVWGATGFVANQVARPWFAHPWQVAVVSIPTALVVALLATRLVVRAIDRWLPLHETTAGRRHDLLGSRGVAVYEITERFGVVSVREPGGDLHQVPCRMDPAHPPVPKGTSVVLTGYNARTRSFLVVPSDAVPGRDVRAPGTI